MRIAYLLSKYPAANHTYLLREVTELRRLGFDIDVISISADDRGVSELTPDERRERDRTLVVKTAGWRTILGSHVRTAVWRPRGYLRGLRAACQLAGPDLRRVAYHMLYFGEAVVVGRWLEQRAIARMHVHYASTVGLLVSSTFAVDVSATLHGSAEFINPEIQRIREKVAGFVRVIAISKFGRSQIMLNSEPAHWDKIDVVPLGVDTDIYTPVESCRWAGTPFRVTFVGQLQPAKGISVLIDAIALLTRQGRSIHATIVGEGADRAGLEAYVESRDVRASVVFVGRMNQDELQAVYRRTDVLVLPSFAEGVPVVLMEAMAHGIPCVASRITGIPELIRDGIDGLLVTPADVEELARALSTLIDDPALAERFAASGLRTVRTRYDLRRNVAQLAVVLGKS